MEHIIRALARKYALELQQNIDERVKEMGHDDLSHMLIYRVLGVSDEEGKQIDLYQNKGRFLYKYAGSFLEEATRLCFKHKFPDSGAKKIQNTEGERPKTFGIDCVVGSDGIEIKWRDATTDGDHITKEHCRIKAIKAAGFRPVRVMFYYPNRDQAVKVQQALETLYKGVDGEYYHGDAAWNYVYTRTEINLLEILKTLAKKNIQPQAEKRR